MRRAATNWQKNIGMFFQRAYTQLPGEHTTELQVEIRDQRYRLKQTQMPSLPIRYPRPPGVSQLRQRDVPRISCCWQWDSNLRPDQWWETPLWHLSPLQAVNHMHSSFYMERQASLVLVKQTVVQPRIRCCHLINLLCRWEITHRFEILVFVWSITWKTEHNIGQTIATILVVKNVIQYQWSGNL
jgi:hypothetical protein